MLTVLLLLPVMAYDHAPVTAAYVLTAIAIGAAEAASRCEHVYKVGIVGQ